MPVEQGEAASPAVLALRQRLAGFETEQGRLAGLGFKPRPGDVLIATSPKCGTTWVQQIVHQLRSRGSMDFEEISVVVPWIEMAHDLGQDLNADQRFTPRAFKTHCWYDHCPKADGVKYIVVVRDPHDVALSFFSFFEGWFFQPGEVSLDEFVRGFWLARGVPSSPLNNASYFHHLLSWWAHRADPNVLFLFYEDLKADLAGHVARICAFLSLDDAEARCKLAADHSSFAFMSAHGSHFDERHSKIARNAACGLPEDAGLRNSKVRAGESGAGRPALSTELAAEIDARWKEVVGGETGCTSYAELRRRGAGKCGEES